MQKCRAFKFLELMANFLFYVKKIQDAFKIIVCNNNTILEIFLIISFYKR